MEHVGKVGAESKGRERGEAKGMKRCWAPWNVTADVPFLSSAFITSAKILNSWCEAICGNAEFLNLGTIDVLVVDNSLSWKPMH